ncbi:MAG: FIST C-terminal domain-containing protein [Chlamydiales bacterium]|nr:FIST C-terminal domain-containing protein [Chlamydiales bacterium]
MKIEQKRWAASSGWETLKAFDEAQTAQLVLAFGERDVLEDAKRYEEMREMYPNAHILSASSSGDILGAEVFDGQIGLSAIYFEKTQLKAYSVDVEDFYSYFACGEKIGLHLYSPDLVHIFVVSDGQKVDGSILVRGIASVLPKECQITGGLAGDGVRFEKTVVGLDSAPVSKRIAAIGFYGKNLRVGYGSVGGWDPFGPLRRVTRSKENVLYELDGQPALGLYKKYLGEKAGELPSSALLFPLALYMPNAKEPLVRTVLNVNEEEGSMFFAGTIPEGCTAQLMKANFERLVEGAGKAASFSHEMIGEGNAEIAILISCVGRRMVLGQKSVEELENVRHVLGKNTAMAGFYSYGEIAPSAPHANCELQNQTMTITTLREV